LNLAPAVWNPIRGAALLVAATLILSAHVGSPDIYLDANAGPYKLFVTIRTPTAIPGVAEIEVHSEGNGVTSISAAPLPMTGPGSQFSPTADQLKRSSQDAQYYTGSLWLMASGAWQVRITADGPQGKGIVSVPVPAVALSTKTMQTGLSVLLLGLMTFLVVGMVAIVGASVREAQLEPGLAADDSRRSRSLWVMAGASILLVGAVILGKLWWQSEADSYSSYIYKPLAMTATLESGNNLKLEMSDPGWIKSRKLDDFVPDHNHLMHLYMLREPGLDIVYHLHPDLSAEGLFRLALPSMPAGEYRLYADVVHKSGFPETPVTSIQLPAITGRPLNGDDAMGQGPALSDASTANSAFTLPDGYRMVWERPAEPLTAKRGYSLKFKLFTPDGSAPSDMALYMGMQGHGAFIKTDGTAFAHIHPIGSVSMAAYMIAQQKNTNAPMSEAGGNGESLSGPPVSDEDVDSVEAAKKRSKVPADPKPATKGTPIEHGAMAGMDHSMMQMSGNITPTAAALPNEVSFPYGFPTPGRYRIFIQMKHGETVETGAFDAVVN
jgi:hypothetical protein